MSFSDFLENALLDHVWGDDSYTAPSPNIYVGLSTTAIQEDGTGVTEPADGYARVEVTNNLTNWPAATTVANVGTKQNGTEIEFATATGDWGEVVDFFFSDAATLGNMVAYGNLDVAKTINEGDTATFEAESITITLD